jgi:hypothetical protein
MRKATTVVIGIGAILTFILIGVVQIGHVTAKSDAYVELTTIDQYAVANGGALGQGTMDGVVAVLHSDPPTASSNNFPRLYPSVFGPGLPLRSTGTGAYGSGGAPQTLCAVNWMHGSGPYAWQGFVRVGQGDCETDQPVTGLVLSLDSNAAQKLTVGDLIEALGAPIAAERPSVTPCVRVRYLGNATNNTLPPRNAPAYVIPPSNFYSPGLYLYFRNGFSAMVPCYDGAQTTLSLDAPVRAVTYTAPVPTDSSAPFVYPQAQWRGLGALSLYYAMCSASDDPRCQGRRFLRGAPNGPFAPPGASAPPIIILPTLVPPGP